MPTLRPPRHFTERDRLLCSVRGERAVLVTLAESFIAEMNRMLNELHEASRCEDFLAILKTARVLKGMVGMYSRSEPFAACQALEQFAFAREDAAAQRQIVELDRVLRDLRAEIQEFTATGVPPSAGRDGQNGPRGQVLVPDPFG